MESSNESYHISFFKPTTERARHNRNMVIWLVSIWFIAIFGFHIILKIIEKPVPESVYVEYANAWKSIQNGTGTEADLTDVARSCLNVLGRIDISLPEKLILQDGFSWSVFQLTPESMRLELVDEIREFNEITAQITSVDNENYIRHKMTLSSMVSPILHLPEYDVRRRIIPFGLTSEGMENLEPENEILLPQVMEKFLIHNRSILTDFKFLGFPFHYFYTAVFLLILFVGLCWIYCVRTDSVNKKLGIAD